MTDIVFLDTETLGLDHDAPVWEFAAIRRQASGTETSVKSTVRYLLDRYPSLLDETGATS